MAPARTLGLLSATVQREANTLAYIDGFWLTVWFAIAALGLVGAFAASTALTATGAEGRRALAACGALVMSRPTQEVS